MNTEIKWTLNHIQKSEDQQIQKMSAEEMAKAISTRVFRNMKRLRLQGYPGFLSIWG